jgi:hypothetical protein
MSRPELRLAINLATRGRPQMLLATLAWTFDNIRCPETVFMVSGDDDDEATVAIVPAIEALGRAKNIRLIVSIAPREDTIGAKWNRILAAAPDADVYLPMCDDGAHVTPGFDARILAAASRWPDGIGVVFNYLENLSFTSIQAVTRRFAELLGGPAGPKIYVEHFPYWFVDHWLSDIAEMIDRVAFAHVRMDCRQPGTQEMRDPAFWATFYDACHLRRRRLANDIIASGEFLIPAWQKAILLERYPLIEGYSKIINDGVRQMEGRGITLLPHDERYIRVKAAAKALLKDEILPELRAAEGKRAETGL